MKVKKGIKIFLLVILILAFIGVTGLLVFKISKTFFGTVVNKEPVIVNSIDGYGYSLSNNMGDEYNKMFNELKDVLNSDTVNDKDYASLVARMLVYDFYNLDTKMSKNDIGGVEFIIDEYRQNFVLEASETVYKYVEHNVYGDRSQELPKVESTEVISAEKKSYKYNNKTDNNAYVVKVKINYQDNKDLGFPKNVEVRMIHIEKEIKEKDSDTSKKYNVLQVFYMK